MVKKEIKEILVDLLKQRDVSPCTRGQVACAILDKDGSILATGFNAPPNNGRCEKICSGFFGVERAGCCSIHAEQNALVHLQNPELATTIITTSEPCWVCLKMITATNISKIYYYSEYLESTSEREKHVDFWVKSGRKRKDYIKLKFPYGIL